GVAGSDDLDRWIALLYPNCAQGSRWTASGITWLAPASANSADATVTVHRVRTVSSTSSTGPSTLTPSRTLVRASKSRARTAEAASAVGGGPLTPSASTNGSRPTRATCSAREPTRTGNRRDGMATTATGRSQLADQRTST